MFFHTDENKLKQNIRLKPEPLGYRGLSLFSFSFFSFPCSIIACYWPIEATKCTTRCRYDAAVDYVIGSEALLQIQIQAATAVSGRYICISRPGQAIIGEISRRQRIVRR